MIASGVDMEAEVHIPEDDGGNNEGDTLFLIQKTNYYTDTLLGDVPINAMGKNIVICVYRQLHPFLQANAFER